LILSVSRKNPLEQLRNNGSKVGYGHSPREVTAWKNWCEAEC
jgi:hypothetical protein